MVLTLLCVERLRRSKKSEPGNDQLWGAQIGGMYDVAGLRVSFSDWEIG